MSPRYLVNDYASMLYQYQGSFTFYTAASGIAGNAISFTQAMTLDASGNLLLGQTSVSLPNGSSRKNVSISGSSETLVSLGLGGAWQSYWYTNATGMQLVANGTNTIYIGNGNGNLQFSSTGAATFSSSVSASTLNLNTTVSTGAKLIVNGYTDFWSATNTLLRVQHNGTIATLQSYTGGANGVIALNPEGGNLLIGTTTDSGYKLDVTGANTIRAYSGNGTTTAAKIFIQAGNQWSLNADVSGGGSPIFSASGFYLRNENTTTNVLGFTVGGAATFSSSVTATSFFESSDKTIKTLLVDNYQTKGIESITAKLYTKHGKEELGYFAQDVQGILPSAVTMGTNGLLNLSYREVLVAKVQSLEQRVLELETQLNLR
jgi:hypothetical protein